MKQEDYVTEIKKLKKERNAIILAHYYQTSDIQEIADFVGDSLALSQKAADNEADVILFAGVKFMAETAKILSPQKKVLLPDIEAGCSLADSCDPKEFKKFIEKYPDHTVITYINTSVEIKALSNIICTSLNAKKIIESLPKGEKIIFAPDINLGNYVSLRTGREMVIWDGACHVHEDISLEEILNIKEKEPSAKIIAHPECNASIRMIADFIGSTTALLKYIETDKNMIYIVATEPGVIYQMKKTRPKKKFIAAPSLHFSHSECNFMKMITIKKIYDCLKKEKPEIIIDENLVNKAVKPIIRMLELSN
ncbi:MAG TPA: quinolinate synthase NadA [Bacteroidetes bacterium]|jgi:quinolinate synthase|nr:quinolinate synthase NadA [Bacteroidota bacterium]